METQNRSQMSPQTFQEKYLPLSSRLYSIALSILCNAEDAEDVVQDTYLRLYENVDKIERVANKEAYLCTMVRNACLNKLRSHHYETDMEEAEDTPDVADTTGQDRLEAADSRSFWTKLLGGLSPKARRIVTLRHIGEYSTHDIALLTGETDSNVRSTLSRARCQLKEAYLRTLREET